MCHFPHFHINRKRTGGIKLEDEAAVDDPSTDAAAKQAEDEYNKHLQEQIQQEKEAKKAEDEKKKADSLWDDFMKDVGGPKPKPKPAGGGGLGSLSKVMLIC